VMIAAAPTTHLSHLPGAPVVSSWKSCVKWKTLSITLERRRQVVLLHHVENTAVVVNYTVRREAAAAAKSCPKNSKSLVRARILIEEQAKSRRT
jgi:hypothetical protein